MHIFNVNSVIPAREIFPNRRILNLKSLALNFINCGRKMKTVEKTSEANCPMIVAHAAPFTPQ